MSHVASGSTQKSERLWQPTLGRALYAAHLLTASIRQAEAAVVKAIDWFDPDRDDEDTPFRYALRAAVEAPAEHQMESTGLPAPVELQAILNLTRELRHCFVLRVLIGMSNQACAQLLGLNVQIVDECTCIAMQRLAGIA